MPFWFVVDGQAPCEAGNAPRYRFVAPRRVTVRGRRGWSQERDFDAGGPVLGLCLRTCRSAHAGARGRPRLRDADASVAPERHREWMTAPTDPLSGRLLRPAIALRATEDDCLVNGDGRVRVVPFASLALVSSASRRGTWSRSSLLLG